jgi:molybdopterin synthase catalytic subunit
LIPSVQLSEDPIDVSSLRRAAAHPGAGAVVVFEGCARDHHEGRAVDLLAYEAYVPMAQAQLAELVQEAVTRFGLLQCLVHHRLGPVPLAEAAVAVVCASAHRREAFEAAAWIMDRIKERVPIWKRELYPGTPPAWVEGRDRHPVEPPGASSPMPGQGDARLPFPEAGDGKIAPG